jgi:hypothetical protein
VTIQGIKDRQSITRWNNVPPALADLLAALAHGAGDHALMGEILAECGRQTGYLFNESPIVCLPTCLNH